MKLPKSVSEVLLELVEYIEDLVKRSAVIAVQGAVLYPLWNFGAKPLGAPTITVLQAYCLVLAVQILIPRPRIDVSQPLTEEELEVMRLQAKRDARPQLRVVSPPDA